MNIKVIIGIIAVVAILGGAGFWLMQRSNSNPNSTPSASTSLTEDSTVPSMLDNPNEAQDQASSSATPGEGAVKEFTVTSQGLKFTPNQMTVNKGDTVKITYKNTLGNHDLKIDEFNAGTKLIGAGQEETIQFVADKAGTFQFYCSVPGHKQAGMVGTLTVQ
jgi:cytochrome c oxidase subunit II